LEQSGVVGHKKEEKKNSKVKGEGSVTKFKGVLWLKEGDRKIILDTSRSKCRKG